MLIYIYKLTPFLFNNIRHRKLISSKLGLLKNLISSEESKSTIKILIDIEHLEMEQQHKENEVIVVVLVSHIFDFEQKPVSLLSFEDVQKPSFVGVEHIPKL